jgi:hypothetical protein
MRHSRLGQWRKVRTARVPGAMEFTPSWGDRPEIHPAGMSLVSSVRRLKAAAPIRYSSSTAWRMAFRINRKFRGAVILPSRLTCDSTLSSRGLM